MSEINRYELVARWMHESNHTVIFTGAGISTESGIPDFRSPGGLWTRVQPVMFQDYVRSAESRLEYWHQKCSAFKEYSECGPNDGHKILAKWEADDRIDAVITQNIDGLHQDAGSKNVIELHGTLRAMRCLDDRCGAEFPPQPFIDDFLETEVVPVCPKCGGLIKHATISFGQSMPEEEMQRAAELCLSCDLMFVLGSSLQVEPAASIPRLAQHHGARVVIINRDPTPQDGSAAAVFHEGIGATLTEIDRRL